MRTCAFPICILVLLNYSNGGKLVSKNKSNFVQVRKFYIKAVKGMTHLNFEIYTQSCALKESISMISGWCPFLFLKIFDLMLKCRWEREREKTLRVFTKSNFSFLIHGPLEKAPITHFNLGSSKHRSRMRVMWRHFAWRLSLQRRGVLVTCKNGDIGVQLVSGMSREEMKCEAI